MGINDSATLEPLLVKQWSKKNKIKPTEVSIGSHKKVIWRCEKGHEWEAVVKSRTIKKGRNNNQTLFIHSSLTSLYVNLFTVAKLLFELYHILLPLVRKTKFL